MQHDASPVLMVSHQCQGCKGDDDSSFRNLAGILGV